MSICYAAPTTPCTPAAPTIPRAAFSSITPGRAPSTRVRRPVSLVYLEQAGDHGQALRREAALKRLTRKEKLALIAAAPPLSDPPIPTEKKTP